MSNPVGGFGQPAQPQQQQAPQGQPFNPQHTYVQEQVSQSPAPVTTGYVPPQPQAQQQQAPNGVAHWMGHPQQQQAPAAQPMMGQQQPLVSPQQQALANYRFQGNELINGQPVPRELIGKTVADMYGIYNQMRQYTTQVLQQQRGGQQGQPAPQGQQQPPQGQQQAPGQPGVVQHQVVSEERIAQVAREQALQVNAPTLIANARAAIQSSPYYQQLAQAVEAKLQGVPVEHLTNPDTWRLAMNVALGEAVAAGQLRPSQPMPQQVPQMQQQAPQQPWGQQQMQNPAQAWVPAPQSMFVEGAQPAAGFQVGGVQLSPQQMKVADMMGIPHAEYAAAIVGNGTPVNTGGSQW